MALKLLNNLWKVIKGESSKKDEDELRRDEITYAESRNTYERMSRQTDDQRGTVGYGYYHPRSEYVASDCIVSESMGQTSGRLFNYRERKDAESYENYSYPYADNNYEYDDGNYDINSTGVVDYNSLKYVKNFEENVYRNLNYDSEDSHFGDDGYDFEHRCRDKNCCLCTDYLTKHFSLSDDEEYSSDFDDEEYSSDGNERYSDDEEERYDDGIYENENHEELHDHYYYDSSDEYYSHGYYENITETKKTAKKIHINPLEIHQDDDDPEPIYHSPVFQSKHEFMENLLFEFYDHLQSCLRKKYSLPPQDIKLAVEKPIFNYKNLNECETPEELDFNDTATCLGYLHRYAICHSALVYHAITRVLTASTSYILNVIGLLRDGAFLLIIDCPLPSVELSALSHFLDPVYSSRRERFNFKEKKTRFGYPNISQCTAFIRVYKKQNSAQFCWTSRTWDSWIHQGH